jgi:SAM-dependent methyltransferase
MISLSKEWALLSRAMYGQEFVDELAELLNKHNVKNVLECGCGDGNILYGLAEKGFTGSGIDANEEMISLALKSPHPNIRYKRMNWLNLDEGKYDAVICRGNSLSFVVNWEKELSNPDQARHEINNSISLFFKNLKKGGLLYVDSVHDYDIGKREVEIRGENIHIKGTIENDVQRKIRTTHGTGTVENEYFEGGSKGYLLTTSELEEIIKSHNPSRILRPKLINENNYGIVCAIK